MGERLRELRPDNGAPAAAAWLEELADAKAQAARPGEPLAQVPAHARPARRSAAAPFVARLPVHAARVRQADDPAAGPADRGPRPGRRARGERGGRVAEGLARTPDPPERVLFVSDSLELAALRRAGVGHEHIPDAAEAQPALAGEPYEEFARAGWS